MDCPHCKSKDTILTSTNKHSQKRLYCKACSNWATKLDAPKILLFDIEISRAKYNVWSPGKQYVGWKQEDKPPFVISWAGKWLFDNVTMGDVVTPRESIKRNDKRVITSIHKLLNQADFVITHNGDKFDIKELNWHFLLNNLTPNNRYKSIDTLKKSREVFRAPSHAMDYLLYRLGYDRKLHTGYELWEQVEQGDQEAINQMYAYNVNDVFMLEDLYLRIRGWMKTHPNFAQFVNMYQELEDGESSCPRCLQSIYKTKFQKKYTTPAGYIYKSCNCPHCGAVLRKTEKMPQERIGVK